MTIDLTSTSIASFTDLMRLIKQTLIASWGKDKVSFHAAYPKVKESDPIPTPIITYGYTKRPGQFNRQQEIKPRVRGSLEVAIGEEVRKVDVLGQTFDYTVTFEVWADTGEEADETAERFQRFMAQYAGYFQSRGVLQIIYEQTDSGQSQNPWRSGLVRRVAQYLVRLDETVGILDPRITDIITGTKAHISAFHMHLDLIKRGEDL